MVSKQSLEDLNMFYGIRTKTNKAQNVDLLRMREENGVFFKPVFKIKFKYMIYDDLDRSGYI